MLTFRATSELVSAAAVVGFSFRLDEEEDDAEEAAADDDGPAAAAELDTRFTSIFRFLEELLAATAAVAAAAAAAAAAFRFLRARL